MCRHLAYLGPAKTLHSLVHEPPHSLVRQSYAPKLNLYNILNADGFGVGWYPADDPSRPLRFRRERPIWTDESFEDVARAVSSTCVLAAVRSATKGSPVDESCAQPLRHGRWLFSHNGRVDAEKGLESRLRELAGDLSAVPEARAPLDSALVFAVAVRHWESGLSLSDGLEATIRAVTGVASGRYTLLVTDGATVAATTWGDSLFSRRGEDSLVLASEPSDDDPGWERIPDRSLVTAALGDGVRVHTL
jgi:glutamine amidotransferase